MLVLVTIVLLLLAAASVAALARRRDCQSLSESTNRFLPVEDFRPLFEPTAEELRAVEREEAAVEKEAEAEKDREEREKELDKFRKLRQTWRASVNKTNTVEIIYEASRTASADAFAETLADVSEAWAAGAIKDLSSDDLAQVLESHFWLLPKSERTPGLSYALREQIANLRKQP
jgi:flagellar motility protein MotE (MotC chaperone)